VPFKGYFYVTKQKYDCFATACKLILKSGQKYECFLCFYRSLFMLFLAQLQTIKNALTCFLRNSGLPFPASPFCYIKGKKQTYHS